MKDWRQQEADDEQALLEDVTNLIRQAADLLDDLRYRKYADGYARMLVELSGVVEQPMDPSRKKPIPQRLRTAVFERDEYRCVECGDHRQLQCDHVYPESLGGEASLENCQTLCKPCNLRKGAKVPA